MDVSDAVSCSTPFCAAAVHLFGLQQRAKGRTVRGTRPTIARLIAMGHSRPPYLPYLRVQSDFTAPSFAPLAGAAVPFFDRLIPLTENAAAYFGRLLQRQWRGNRAFIFCAFIATWVGFLEDTCHKGQFAASKEGPIFYREQWA
eukprot:scaffold122958_cov15-Tisochrysis_lutea.AAC.1